MLPHAIGGAAGERHSGNAEDAADQTVPIGLIENGAGIKDLDDKGFLTGTPDRISDLMTLQRSMAVSEFRDLAEQGPLIAFHLNQQRACFTPNRLESCFGSAWRRE